MSKICGFIFNDTQFGWDTCNKKPGHKGDHYDDISKHRYPQARVYAEG